MYYYILRAAILMHCEMAMLSGIEFFLIIFGKADNNLLLCNAIIVQHSSNSVLLREKGS